MDHVNYFKDTIRFNTKIQKIINIKNLRMTMINYRKAVF